jgi:hypothetical protein
MMTLFLSRAKKLGHHIFPYGVFPLSQNSEISIGKQFWLDGNGVQVENKGI